MFDRRPSQPAAHSFAIRSIAAVLSCVLFAETALASQAQLSVWADRPARLAPAAPVLPPLLPEIRRAEPAVHVGAGVELPADFLTHVRVKSVAEGRRPGAIVLLEDVHGNGEAQAHLSAALRALGDQPGASPVRVALEGAAGEFLFAAYHRFPSVVATRVADAFLQAGLIGGPSHAGFVCRSEDGHRGLVFSGAEDADLYRSNVAAYRRSGPDTQVAAAMLASEAKDLAERRSTLFSADLRSLDDAVARHHGGAMPLGDFAALLAARGVPATRNTTDFITAWTLERTLDMARVDLERRQVLEKLVARLKAPDLRVLLDLSLGYRRGAVTFGRYYAGLADVCRRAGVDLSATPSFASYLRYVLLADAVDAARLFDDVERMENAAYAAATRNEDERRLVDALRRHRLSERLLRFGLTSNEWNAYRRLGASPAALAGFEDFYRSAEARNDALARSAESADGLSVLVAGGFHTDGIAARLAADGRAVIVCAPKLTRVDADGATAYLSVFERERTPLERLFSGERLFLAPPPAGAAVPLVAAPNETASMAFVANALSNAGGLTTDQRDDVDAASHELGEDARLVGVYQRGGTVVVRYETDTSLVEAVITHGGAAERSLVWRTLETHAVGADNVALRARPKASSVASGWMSVLTLAMALGIPATINAAMLFNARRGEDKQNAAKPQPQQASLNPILFGLAALLAAKEKHEDGDDNRVRKLSDLAEGSRGLRLWLEGVHREDLVAPDANIVLLARSLSANDGSAAAIREVLAGSNMAEAARVTGLQGANVTVAPLLDDLENGRYDAEVAELLREGVTDPRDIVGRLLSAVAVVSEAALIAGGRDPRALLVAEDTDEASAVVEGGEPRVMADTTRVVSSGRNVAVRMMAYLFGRNGVERRGAVDRRIYQTTLAGGIPSITGDFGVHTYLLTVKAFLYGLLDRTNRVLDEAEERSEGTQAAEAMVRAEVVRMSASMNSVSFAELDGHPRVGFDAIIDEGIRLEFDRIARAGRDAAAVEAAQRRIALLERIRGKGGVAMAKVAHEIHMHIFFGEPLHERQIEELFGSWMLPDIHDARGAVRAIAENTGVAPFQRFVIGSPTGELRTDAKVSEGDVALRLTGLASGWREGRASRSIAMTGTEMSIAASFLKRVGLPRRDLADEGIPTPPASGLTLAESLADSQAGRESPLDILTTINETLLRLQAENRLPAEILSASRDHSRWPVSISDVVEVVQDAVAQDEALIRTRAESAAASALSRASASGSASNRTLKNRLLLGLPLVAIQAVIVALAAAAPHESYVIASILVSVPATIFFWQAGWIAAAAVRSRRGSRPWALHWALGLYTGTNVGAPGSVLGAQIIINRALARNMGQGQQMSILREERRHQRYRTYWNLAGLRSPSSIALEEIVVNLVMPITDIVFPDPEMRRARHPSGRGEVIDSLRRLYPSFNDLASGFQPTSGEFQRLRADYAAFIAGGGRPENYLGVLTISTSVDRALDAASRAPGPGQRLLEKMMRKRHFGELLRRAVGELREITGLFDWRTAEFQTPYGLSPQFVTDLVAAWNQPDKTPVMIDDDLRRVFAAHRLSSSREERFMTAMIADAIVRRGSRLEAMYRGEDDDDRGGSITPPASPLSPEGLMVLPDDKTTSTPVVTDVLPGSDSAGFIGGIILRGWRVAGALIARIEAGAWIREGRALQAAAPSPASLVEILDAAAPRGRLFERGVVAGFAAATPDNPAASAAHWAGLAGYRRSIARNGGAGALAALDRSIRAETETEVVVYHVNQLSDPSLLKGELDELEAILIRSAVQRADGRKVSVIAAVAGALPAEAAERLAAITANTDAAVIAVSDDLRAGAGEAYSYEKLLSAAVAASPQLEAARALSKGNYDRARFVTFSKIPSQFLADGRLRMVWTLLANIGAGWAPVSVDTLIRATQLAARQA